jgi:hypothetical protein
VSALFILRRAMLAVLVLGMVGTFAELLLLEHYEEPAQYIPLFLFALATAVLGWHAARPTLSARRALQGMMALFLVAGGAGMALHFRGAAEFQRELDPHISPWDLTKKVMRAKAPPVLAPGVMLQLGLLGLAYAYRNPDVPAPPAGGAVQ